MKHVIAVVGLAMLAGCLPLSSVPPREYYVLSDLEGMKPMPRSPSHQTLLVSPTSVSEFYDSQSLVFSRASNQRAYYQFAAWTERPGKRLTELLIRRLAASGGFGSVTATTAGAQGDLVLNTRLDDLYYDARTKPGSVRIELFAELVDPARRAIVAQRTFVQTAPARDDAAPAAVAAFDSATTKILGEVAAWAQDTARRPMP